MRSGGGPPAEVSWDVPGPYPLARSEVREAVAAALAHGGRPQLLVGVIFVSDARLARLHGRYLADPAPTDVMAFELGEQGGGPAAELYVSVERARAEARRRDLAPERELALYVVHGSLHLCGFEDHRPRARARMRAAEDAVLRRLGYGPE